VCVAISRCDFCHGDTIHTTRFQPKCYPPQLLVCIRQNTSMSSYLHRDGAPVDTPCKITTSHDNLFSRYGLGCFHPKRFPNHFVEEGEDDDDEVARIHLRCGWIKDMALWQVQWNTTHRSTIRMSALGPHLHMVHHFDEDGPRTFDKLQYVDFSWNSR
jgi:hypothetical protein